MLDQVRDTATEIADEFLGTTDIEKLPIEIGCEGEDSPPVSIENIDGEEVLLLNLDSIEDSREERILSSASSEVWSEQEGLFDYQIGDNIRIVSKGLTSTKIRSITAYFDDHLPKQEVDLLRRCLYLRLEWEDEDTYTDSRQMTSRKASLRREYDDRAIIVSNLASSGYYDKNGYIRRIFEKIETDHSITPSEYLDVYREILRDQPFSVFVSGQDNVPEIKGKMISKYNALDTYMVDLDFVDIRAQGGSNRGKLEQSVLEIQRDANLMHYEAWVRPRETCYRIYQISKS